MDSDHPSRQSGTLQKLCDLVERKLNAAGYWFAKQITPKMKRNPKPHGIDRSKFGSASSIYYLPSTPIGGMPEFHDFADELRGPLNVIMWLRDACLHTKPEEDSSEAASGLRGALEGLHRRWRCPTGQIDEAAIKRAVETWQQAPARAGDKFFYMLACRLMSAGLGYEEVEQKLREQCVYVQSKDDRRRQIPRIMSSLRRAGTWTR